MLTPVRGTSYFIKEKFEYTAHCNSRWSSANENMLIRIRNSVVAGLNQQKTGGFLPKYVVIVLDDDLITFLDYKKDGVATLLGSWVEWLVKEIKVAFTKRIDQLPKKSKKSLPFFYWVTAPTHSYFSKERNALRVKFNLSLESVICAQEDMRVIKIKEGWNAADSKLVIQDRTTSAGLTSYWYAVDASFRYNSQRRDLYLAKKLVSEANEARDSTTASTSRDVSDLYARDDPMRNFF